jgi:Domain of unknown function (DUF4190)
MYPVIPAVPYGYAVPTTTPWRSGLATSALVLGIISVPLNLFSIPSILAIIFGWIAKNQAEAALQAGQDARSARSSAMAGFILGIVMTVLVWGFWIIFWSIPIIGAARRNS